MAFNRSFKPQSPDAGAQGFDNFVAQANVLESTKMFTELRMKAGKEQTGEERKAGMQLRDGMIDEISQLARQAKEKIFSDEEYAKMEAMSLRRLRSELGHWYSEAGIKMIKEPPKVNQFAVMEPFWRVVRANREHFIKTGRARPDQYKIIIIRETEATDDEKKAAAETIEVEKPLKRAGNEIVDDMEILDKAEEDAEKEAEGSEDEQK